MKAFAVLPNLGLLHYQHNRQLSCSILGSFQKLFTVFLCSGVARFYFDFSTTYIGAGMICPHIVNVSVLLGGILSWGVMWPLIAEKRGSWFDATLKDSSLEGMQGYRVGPRACVPNFRFYNLLFNIC